MLVQARQQEALDKLQVAAELTNLDSQVKIQQLYDDYHTERAASVTQLEVELQDILADRDTLMAQAVTPPVAVCGA